MTILMAALSGKKTYLVALIMLLSELVRLIDGGTSLGGFIDFATSAEFLGPIGLMTLRAGIAKAQSGS